MLAVNVLFNYAVNLLLINCHHRRIYYVVIKCSVGILCN
jgi:hypothetical protein